MKDIDELIRQSLSEEEAEWFAEWDEQSLTEKVVDSFRGKSRWLVILVYLAVLIFSVLMFISAVRFFRADSTREMIFFATGFLFCALGVTMMKIWYWLELNRNTILRDIKRLELQVARLAGRMVDPGSLDTQ